MSEDRKIAEYEGIKYYSEEGQWYRLLPIGGGQVPVDIKKAKRRIEISLPQENLLDVFKFLDFDQLLTFQQTSFYFKNIVDKYGKELARKKFARLEFLSKCENGEFVKIEEPHLYDFELSKQLKKKWIRGIEESIPMFLIRSGYKDVDTVVCELEQNNKGKKALYHIKLSKFPQNLEEMAIARYLFKLIFNCAFEYFEISRTIINPQMIQLLFDETTTNFPLQIHSQKANFYTRDHFSFNFIWNHLICNQVRIVNCILYEDENMDVLLKILTQGGNKFLNITYLCVAGKLYNPIIKHIETSQFISEMVKQIKFECIFGSKIPSETVENIKIDGKTTKFQIFNKHNPKIKFSVTAKEPENDEFNGEDVKYKNVEVAFNATIKRIN